MSSHTAIPPARTNAESSPTAPPVHLDQTTRKASLVAGAGILLMTPLAVLANFVVLERLVAPGDPAATAQALLGSEGLVRLGIVSLLLVVALDVVVAWALLHVFSPVSRTLSLLATCLRLVYAGVFLVAVAQLVGVMRLLGGAPYLSAFTPAQLQAQALGEVNAFHEVWGAGLLLFGLHLLLLGYLAYRSAYVPRVLGVLLAVAGLGYLVDAIVAVLAPDVTLTLASVTFVGEFLLALWLVRLGLQHTAGAGSASLVRTEGSRRAR